MFGVGGESLNMAVNTYTVTWFRDTDLNMVFGLQLSVSRLVLQKVPSEGSKSRRRPLLGPSPG